MVYISKKYVNCSNATKQLKSDKKKHEWIKKYDSKTISQLYISYVISRTFLAASEPNNINVWIKIQLLPLKVFKPTLNVVNWLVAFTYTISRIVFFNLFYKITWCANSFIPWIKLNTCDNCSSYVFNDLDKQNTITNIKSEIKAISIV